MKSPSTNDCHFPLRYDECSYSSQRLHCTHYHCLLLVHPVSRSNIVLFICNYVNALLDRSLNDICRCQDRFFAQKIMECTRPSECLSHPNWFKFSDSYIFLKSLLLCRSRTLVGPKKNGLVQPREGKDNCFMILHVLYIHIFCKDGQFWVREEAHTDSFKFAKEGDFLSGHCFVCLEIFQICACIIAFLDII